MRSLAACRLAALAALAMVPLACDDGGLAPALHPADASAYNSRMTVQTTTPAQTARQLLRSQRLGMLSTLSVDMPGYPFGSLTPYALDQDGRPLILISTLAQHTKNIQADNHVSLLVYDTKYTDVHAAARLTLVGQAVEVPESDTTAKARYLRYFPEAESFFKAHDFQLYRIELKRARFIGGFGQIFWVEPDEMRQANPFVQTEAGIVGHMNDDHAHTMVAYCQAFMGLHPSEVRMLGIDAEGFDLQADEDYVRFNFEAPLGTPEEARAALVRLARRAAEALQA